MTSDCLFTFVFLPFLPAFTCFVPKIVLNIKKKQFFGAKQVNSGKNGEKHRSKQTISGHILA
jgi:hypothetical protein